MARKVLADSNCRHGRILTALGISTACLLIGTGAWSHDRSAEVCIAAVDIESETGIPLAGYGAMIRPIDDLRFSSDVLGQIEINIERVIAHHNKANHYRPVILFMNGAEGDVGNPVRAEEAVVSDGIRFAEQAVEAQFLTDMRPVDPDISVKRSRVWLGMPAYSPKICAKNKDSFIARRGLGLKIPLVFLFPQNTYITAVTVGDILMMTWPGEASTQVGFDLQNAVSGLGYENAWALGLANDYMSYFATKEEYAEGKYDSCISLFGWKGAERIRTRYMEMLATDFSGR